MYVSVHAWALAYAAACACAHRFPPHPVVQLFSFLLELLVSSMAFKTFLNGPCLILRRYIVQYIGLGSTGEGGPDEEDGLMAVLHSAFIVQEYINGGTLKKMVLEQVRALPLGCARSPFVA